MRAATAHLLVARPPQLRADHRRARSVPRASASAPSRTRSPRRATAPAAPSTAGEFTVEHGRRATAEILASDPRPTAIIAGGNMLMQGALLALRAAQIEVGREISFVGCDDVVVAEVHQPPIAVVRRDMLGDRRRRGGAAARRPRADGDGEDDDRQRAGDPADRVRPPRQLRLAPVRPTAPATAGFRSQLAPGTDSGIVPADEPRTALGSARARRRAVRSRAVGDAAARRSRR